MKTSIIILTYNQLEYTKKCIESIRQYTPQELYELIVVDNHSQDGTVEWLKQQKDMRVLYNTVNLGFPKGCNQGMAVAKEQSILLLNNDTIVTPRWLEQLLFCLYSAKEIGAVGPVTNSAPYYQSMPVAYQNINEMQLFAQNHNQSDFKKWEERLKLIGFCILIKREVIDKIGALDEIFTPGNYEDDDYCVRMSAAGYKMLLCNDTFIHHYGGTSFKETGTWGKVLTENEQRFKNKWGFCSSENMDIYLEIRDKINRKTDEAFQILEVGCGCGANLLYIQNRFKNAKLFGMDKNLQALHQAERIAHTVAADLETDAIDFEEDYFDYILLGDVLAFLKTPQAVLQKLHRCIKTGGEFILCIPNAIQPTQLYNILKNHPADHDAKLLEVKKIIHDKNTLLVDTYHALNEMHCQNITVTKVYTLLDENENRAVDYLCEALGSEYKDQYTTKRYIITATVSHKPIQPPKGDLRELKFLLRRIENEVDTKESIEALMGKIEQEQVTEQDILTTVYESIIEKVSVLNTVAVKCFEKGLYDNVVPLLEVALGIDPQHKDTRFNLGFVFNAMGEQALALRCLEPLEGTDEEVNTLLAEIRGEQQGE